MSKTHHNGGQFWGLDGLYWGLAGAFWGSGGGFWREGTKWGFLGGVDGVAGVDIFCGGGGKGGVFGGERVFGGGGWCGGTDILSGGWGKWCIIGRNEGFGWRNLGERW